MVAFSLRDLAKNRAGAPTRFAVLTKTIFEKDFSLFCLQMNKKLIFLFVALLLPGLIYTFLKLFGSNRFQVAPLFQTEIKVPAGCPEVTAPYEVPQDVFSSLSLPPGKDSLFLVFYEMDETKLGSTAGNINEIEETVASGKDGIRLVKIHGDTLKLRCPLLMEPDMDIVLLDQHRRIRGQYTSTDRDEVDRLSTELDIMLKKY